MPGAGRVLLDPAAVLRDRGLLLLSDSTLPSLATIVAGEPIRGSWWGHPKSHQIFATARRLGRDPDIVAIPLVNTKITFVHRRLWPPLLASARTRESWQTRGLTAAARTLLKRVEHAGELEASGPAVHELERRLLVISREIHTDRGAHTKIAESWERWAKRMGVAPWDDVDAARRELENAAATLGPRATLPWQARR
jgi:hypothetical protein